MSLMIAPNELSGFFSTRTTKGGLSAMTRSFPLPVRRERRGGSQLVPRLWQGTPMPHVNGHSCASMVKIALGDNFYRQFPRPLPARAGARLSKQGADSRRYKDHRSGQQQSTDDLFV